MGVQSTSVVILPGKYPPRMAPIEPTPLTNPVAVPAPRLVPKSMDAVAEIIESGPNRKAPPERRTPPISQRLWIRARPMNMMPAVASKSERIAGARRRLKQFVAEVTDCDHADEPADRHGGRGTTRCRRHCCRGFRSTYFGPQKVERVSRVSLIEKVGNRQQPDARRREHFADDLATNAPRRLDRLRLVAHRQATAARRDTPRSAAARRLRADREQQPSDTTVSLASGRGGAQNAAGQYGRRCRPPFRAEPCPKCCIAHPANGSATAAADGVVACTTNR